MPFTTENEKQNRISFLNVQIIRKDKTIAIFVYSELLSYTFCLPFCNTHFDSFLPSTYKFGTVYTLAYRCFRTSSRWTKLHTELVCLKQFFLKNGYPENFVLKDLCITNTWLKRLF